MMVMMVMMMMMMLPPRLLQLLLLLLRLLVMVLVLVPFCCSLFFSRLCRGRRSLDSAVSACVFIKLLSLCVCCVLCCSRSS